MKKRILIVVGTRPNFIKVTRFKEVVAAHPDLEVLIVHTGQHYDNKMAAVFFEQFGLAPDHILKLDSTSASEQIKEISSKLEVSFRSLKPDLVVVVGDVNSTLAAAQAAHRSKIELAHVESGLRSFDETMPEEFNRIETDKITDLFFVTEQSGIDNLVKEGVSKEKIHFVGNTMIDTLVKFNMEIEASTILHDLKLNDQSYVLMTMHRPATVDSKKGLGSLYDIIKEVDPSLQIVFPVHPRTLKRMEEFGLAATFRSNKHVLMIEPLDYFAFQKLIKYSKFILTDSGGIQEESTYLKVPCLTLRPNTERPVTIAIGTNELIPFETKAVKTKMDMIMNGKYKKGDIPPLWDGRATERIVKTIIELFQKIN